MKCPGPHRKVMFANIYTCGVDSQVTSQWRVGKDHSSLQFWTFHAIFLCNFTPHPIGIKVDKDDLSVFNMQFQAKNVICNLTFYPKPCGLENLKKKMTLLCRSGNFIQFPKENFFAAWPLPHEEGGLEKIAFLCISGHFLQFLAELFFFFNFITTPASWGGENW